MLTPCLACSIEPMEVAPSEVTINKVVHKTNYPKVVNLIDDAFRLVGSQKTMKYFIESEDYDQRLVDVVDTLEAIRCSQSNTICIEDGYYQVSDYKIPVRLTAYVNSGIIYASSDAIGSKKPIIKVDVCKGKLTPLQFNKFFDDFNANQDKKLDTNDSFTRSAAVLGDVQYAEDEQGMMLKLNDGGLDLETCYLIGLKLTGLESFLTKYSKPNKDGMTKWLFG